MSSDKNQVLNVIKITRKNRTQSWMRRMKTKTNQERRTRTETEKKEIINPVADLVQPISSTTYTSFPQFFISTVQGLISREFFNSKLSYEDENGQQTVKKLQTNLWETERECRRERERNWERGNAATERKREAAIRVYRESEMRTRRDRESVKRKHKTEGIWVISYYYLWKKNIGVSWHP